MHALSSHGECQSWSPWSGMRENRLTLCMSSCAGDGQSICQRFYSTLGFRRSQSKDRKLPVPPTDDSKHNMFCYFKSGSLGRPTRDILPTPYYGVIVAALIKYPRYRDMLVALFVFSDKRCTRHHTLQRSFVKI